MTGRVRADAVTLRFADLALAKIAAHAARSTAGVSRLVPGLVGRFTPGWTPGRRDTGASVSRDPDGGGIDVAVRVVVGLDLAGSGPLPADVVAAVARRMRDELSALVDADVRPEVTVVDLDV